MGKLNKAVGLAAVAAAGAYLFYGKNAKKRQKIRGWIIKAKGEVLEKVEKLNDVNQETYHKVIEKVTNRYKHFKEINAQEFNELVSDLKASWGTYKKELKNAEKPKKTKEN